MQRGYAYDWIKYNDSSDIPYFNGSKDCVDKLARKTNRSSSYFYNQMVADHIDELEDVYDCLAIIENVKKGKEKTVPLEAVMKGF